MSNLSIVSRAGWRARPPRSRRTITTPTPRLWIHHTAVAWHGPEGVRKTQNYHMDSRGYADIAYSFLVDTDGTIYEGRGAGVQGGHTAGDNSSSHAICAMGNFEERQPTDAQVMAIARLAAHGREKGWWGDITGGHRDAPRASTSCPGRHLYARLGDMRQAASSSPTSATLTTDTSTSNQEPLLMAAAKDDNDARAALIRLWFWQFLGRGPRSATEFNSHIARFAQHGADAALTVIVDSPEAAAYRGQR